MVLSMGFVLWRWLVTFSGGICRVAGYLQSGRVFAEMFYFWAFAEMFCLLGICILVFAEMFCFWAFAEMFCLLGICILVFAEMFCFWAFASWYLQRCFVFGHLQRCFVSWAFAERSLSLYILLDNDPTTTLLPYTIQTIQLYHHITFLYYYINPLI